MPVIRDEQQMQIKKEWKDFIINHKPPQTIRPEIAEAWARCAANGVLPTTRVAPKIHDAGELEKRLQRNSVLISVSKEAIEYLYHFINGSRFTIAISDVDGYLLLVCGDQDVVDSAMVGNGIVGANWSETGIGNNPIGTSIVENRPLQVFGCEHYCLCAHNWTGSGAPIHNASGQIIGAISICGEKEKTHYHTLGMAVMTAYAIEKQLKILSALDTIDDQYNQKNIIIDAITEGILVLNRNHKVALANRYFLETFRFEPEQIINQDISSIFSDRYLLSVIKEQKEATDYITTLNAPLDIFSCITTYNPFQNNSSQRGVMIVNDVNRYHDLAQKIVNSEIRFTFRNIIGKDPHYLESVSMARHSAGINANVLLLGESGTGKDVFAQAIHNSSPRRNANFVTVNCGAIPKELISSELFGYAEGAFTGAKRGGNKGKFELAEGGTLFLDEIGEMPLDMQTVLLRAIEQRVIYRVGGQSPIPIDVRIIAATNKNLLEEVNENRFRKDLYYRLNILCIHMVPLRERPLDIPLLAEHFLTLLNAKYQKNIEGFSPEVMNCMCRYSWPGNIRELQNLVERMVAFGSQSIIDISCLPPEMQNGSGMAPAKPVYEDRPDEVSAGLEDAKLSEFPEQTEASGSTAKASLNSTTEKAQFLQALEECHWNISATANMLQLSRSTMYRRLREYGLRK